VDGSKTDLADAQAICQGRDALGTNAPRRAKRFTLFCSNSASDFRWAYFEPSYIFAKPYFQWSQFAVAENRLLIHLIRQAK
jgi:hypothetical protein